MHTEINFLRARLVLQFLTLIILCFLKLDFVGGWCGSLEVDVRNDENLQGYGECIMGFNDVEQRMYCLMFFLLENLIAHEEYQLFKLDMFLLFYVYIYLRIWWIC